MKKRTLFLLFILIVGTVAGIFIWRENRTVTRTPQHEKVATEMIQRGEYLSHIADCTACHTAEEGAYMAGGFALDTPFGILYGSNITPSLDHGIGRWTSDEFYGALTEGVSPPSKHLYPAMPYTSYHKMPKADSDAIFAYLLSLEPVDVAVKRSELPFPLNQSALIIGWNMLFFDKAELPGSSEGSSPEWERGKYLANVLGHCGMCHSPIGEFGQIDMKHFMEGGNLGRIVGPDVTPKALAERGWTRDGLKDFFLTGISEHGSAFDEMYKVVNLSTKHLTPEDTEAMVTYLMGDQPIVPKAISIGEGNAKGRNHYQTFCAACHMADGTGKPHIAIPMINNSTLRNEDSQNLIVSILDGIPRQTFVNNESMQEMPSFADKMSDEEMADLVNYLRETWGGLKPTVTATEVQNLRK